MVIAIGKLKNFPNKVLSLYRLTIIVCVSVCVYVLRLQASVALYSSPSS